MRKINVFLILFLLICLGSTPAMAEQGLSWQAFRLSTSEQTDVSAVLLSEKAKLAWEERGATDFFVLALSITPPQGTYFYSTSTTFGLPTQLDAKVFIPTNRLLPKNENIKLDAGNKDDSLEANQGAGKDASKQDALNSNAQNLLEVDTQIGDGFGLPVFAPSPIAKKDTVFASTKLVGVDDATALIYPEKTTFFALVPVFEHGVAVRVNVQALFCSAKSCMPFYDSLELSFSPEEIARFVENPNTLWLKSIDAQASGTGGLPKSSDGNAGQANASLQPNIALEQYANLQPVYFSPDLEVQGLWQAMFFGLLAGLILNLMPCVLPVVSLKFSALLAVTGLGDAKAKARAFRAHCLLFALGVLVWFLILAMLIGVVGLAWGGLFQNPYIIAALGFVLFLLSLSLFNVFTLPIFDLKVASNAHPHWQAFASGVLATLLATPCSGPLLGGVLGWAISQPLHFLSLTIGSVGLGMALPYILMAFFPRLVNALPKPGAWTLRLEQILGFFLMATVAYMATLLPAEWLPAFIFNLVSLSIAAWLWGQIGHLGASTSTRFISKACAIVFFGFTIFLGFQSLKEDFTWEKFDAAVFQQTLGKENMLVEFTADWCPSCKAMELTTLNKKRMSILQSRFEMRTIRVDLTRKNPGGEALLKSLGSTSIPVLALFPAGKNAEKPVVLRDIVTPEQLDKALQATFGS